MVGIWDDEMIDLRNNGTVGRWYNGGRTVRRGDGMMGWYTGRDMRRSGYMGRRDDGIVRNWKDGKTIWGV